MSSLHENCLAFVALARRYGGDIHFRPEDGPYATEGEELDEKSLAFLKGICENHHLKLGQFEMAGIRRYTHLDERPRDKKGRFFCDLTLMAKQFEVNILVNAYGWNSEVEWRQEARYEQC